MARRDPREARILGLWTAGWLAVLLVAGLLWVGDLSIQWPVLVVPLLWALIAARPRGRRGGRDEPSGRDRPRGWEVVPPARTDTVERPAVYDPTDRRGGPA
jgi:hypothetical protein